jgi:hypothetical protein
LRRSSGDAVGGVVGEKRRRFSAQAAAQATSFCAAIPIDWQRVSSAARGSTDGFGRAVVGSGSAL